MFGWFKRKKKAKKQVEKKEQVITPEVVEEPEVVEPEVVEPEIVEQPEVVEEPEVEEEEEKKERKMPYHITKHPKGGWQVKKGKADRALKRFDTQKEAIEYAKELEKTRGISYVIHKADGSIRKKEY